MSSIVPLKGKPTHLIGWSEHPAINARLAWYYGDETSAVVHAYTQTGDFIGRLYARPDGSMLMADDANLEPGLLLYLVPLDEIEEASSGLLRMLLMKGFAA